MKTKTITVYSVSELSDKAKETAYNQWLRNFDYPWAGENRDTLKKFERVFPITIDDWSYGGRGEGVSFHFNTDDAIEELSGQRLATYLWNNYRDELYKGKYYSLWSKTDKNPHYTEGGHAPWGALKSRHSRIMIEGRNCVLTGFCMDEAILGPIYDFIDKPDKSVTFRELIEDCFDKWVKACSEDMENAQTMESFEEDAEANEWEYDEDGNQE